MISTQPLLLLLACLLQQSVSHKTLGINCKGSTRCHAHFTESNLVTDMYNLFSTNENTTLGGGPVAPGTVYQAGSDIACYNKMNGGVCLFMQGNVPQEGVNASVITQRLGDLMNHGCKTCGSVPLSGDNNPNAKGILTLNYVAKDADCEGVCNPITSTAAGTSTSTPVPTSTSVPVPTSTTRAATRSTSRPMRAGNGAAIAPC